MSVAPLEQSSFELYNERTIIDGLFLGAIAYGTWLIESSKKSALFLYNLFNPYRHTSDPVHLVFSMLSPAEETSS